MAFNPVRHSPATREAGLTPVQHQALLAVQGFPGEERVTIGELAEPLQIVHHSAVGLVNRLVSHDLLARQASLEDRRQVYVALTARGNEILQGSTAAHKRKSSTSPPHLELLLQRIAQTG